jgi:hypothetical protein
MAVQMKYPCQRFSTLARGGGAGFRQLARLDHYRNLHFERTMYNRFRLPFELRLGRGLPLNPYLRGVIIYFRRKEIED